MTPADLTEIRNILYDLKEDMGAARADCAAMRDTIRDRGTRLDGVETRLRRVEAKQHWYAGFAAMGGAVLTFLGKKAGIA